MKKVLFLVSLSLLAVAVSCGKKTEAKAELEKAAEVMAQNEPQPPPPAPEPAAPAVPEAAAMPETPAEPAVAPAQEMRQVVVEYKAGKLEEAVIRLQKLRSVNSLTAQQRMVLQDSVAAVMNEIYELAAKGDPKAIQAVKQYEELQNRRR